MATQRLLISCSKNTKKQLLPFHASVFHNSFPTTFSYSSALNSFFFLFIFRVTFFLIAADTVFRDCSLQYIFFEVVITSSSLSCLPLVPYFFSCFTLHSCPHTAQLLGEKKIINNLIETAGRTHKKGNEDSQRKTSSANSKFATYGINKK